jgi:hypothetical protein
MKINEDFNITLVHQFFSTVVFGEGKDIPMTWMFDLAFVSLLLSLATPSLVPTLHPG